MASTKSLQEVVPSASRNAGGNSSPFDLSTADQCRVYVHVSAVGGTIGAGTKAYLQDTPDGTNWYDVAASADLTAVGQYPINVQIPFGDSGRIRWEFQGGSTPSLTFSVQLLRVELS